MANRDMVKAVGRIMENDRVDEDRRIAFIKDREYLVTDGFRAVVIDKVVFDKVERANGIDFICATTFSMNEKRNDALYRDVCGLWRSVCESPVIRGFDLADDEAFLRKLQILVNDEMLCQRDQGKSPDEITVEYMFHGVKVNAMYLLNMLQIFPDAYIIINAYNRNSPLAFMSRFGRGILMPIYQE